MFSLDFFLIFMSLLLACGMSTPFVLVMQCLMPKAVLEQYWRGPHFRPAELALFSGIYAPMRTVMLMWLIAFPRFGKKRGITEADKLAPQWYKFAARFVTVWILATTGSVVFLSAGVFIHGYATGHPTP